MLITNIAERMTSDRIEWRKKNTCGRHDYFVEDPQLIPKTLGLRLGCCYCHCIEFDSTV